LVILDLNMPDRNPFDLLSEIKAAYPTTKVLVYSIQPEGQVGVRVLKAGADGFLAKSGSADELIAAVDRVLSGKRFISESLADDLALAVSRRAASPAHALLSDREYLVLKLLGSGCTPTVIAEQLHMSVKTVSSHRARILQKLNLNSTADLIRYAVEERL